MELRETLRLGNVEPVKLPQLVLELCGGEEELKSYWHSAFFEEFCDKN